MHLADVVATSAEVSGTRSRTAKVAALAGLLRRASADGPRTVELAAAFLAGQVPHGRLGVGWRGLRSLPDPAAEPSLTIGDVDDAFTTLAAAAGPGSQTLRRQTLDHLWAAATPEEQRFLAGLVTGDIRQGALDGVMQQAVAAAAGVLDESVRRAAMLAGRTWAIAGTAIAEGEPGLARVTLQVGRPVAPMLAAAAPTIDDALPTTARVAVERKLDGIRIQAHLHDGRATVFTRGLEDITARLPEVAEVVEALDCSSAVLDGEAIALDPAGRPRPFQVTGARTASSKDVAALREATPLSVFLFDLLYLDGESLIDEPLSTRRECLRRLVAPQNLVEGIDTDSAAEARTFFDAQIAAGHEGVVVKDLASRYAAGRRLASWTKVKPRHTLDLVVLAVERGSGRRRGWLSNIHLGARDPVNGGFVMLGKTFKGMTDEMLAWQTQRFGELAVDEGEWVVTLRPEQVVEIAFDGVQRSSTYPGGLALRFARVLRYRDDKSADEADTIDTVRALAGG